MDELKEALESVSDCYDDFIEGVMMAAKDDEDSIEKIIAFIYEDENRTTSDIIEYLDELGI